MKTLIVSLITYLLLTSSVQSQGCIMVHNILGFGQYNLADNAFTTSTWHLNVATRYLNAK